MTTITLTRDGEQIECWQISAHPQNFKGLIVSMYNRSLPQGSRMRSLNDLRHNPDGTYTAEFITPVTLSTGRRDTLFDDPVTVTVTHD